MHQSLSDRLQQILERNPAAFAALNRGVEKEGLRTLEDGRISHTDHPKSLGSALTHPAITTDYSEALLELITPAYPDIDQMLGKLEDLHRLVYRNLPSGETLWVGSMPCKLAGDESVRIAEYGDSNSGKLKHTYRRGLAHRYGRIMQSIAGLHFNFSVGEEFWGAVLENAEDGEALQQAKTGGYFGLIRNFRRWSWLLMYLFGASPALDASFLNGRPSKLEQLAPDTFGLPYATSLRMSGLGYQNNAQSSLHICFNYLHTYTKTLYDAIHTPYPPYEKYGVMKGGEYQQLNTNILQIENEYYNTIRPKRVTARGEKPLQALQRRGIEYIEVRCLDLNPLLPLGIDRQQACFMDAFLLTCMLAPNPLISDMECDIIDQNFTKTVEQGRKPGVALTRIIDGREQDLALTDWAHEIFDNMSMVAECLGQVTGNSDHADSIRALRQRLEHPEKTPSALCLDGIHADGGYLKWLLALSQRHQANLSAKPFPESLAEQAQETAAKSWQDEENLRKSDQIPFAEYLLQYLEYS